MSCLIADSGSTKTHWALVSQQPGMPRLIHTHQTLGLNPLYVTPQQITSALREVLAAVGEACPAEVRFYGSGCSGDRVGMVEQALRAALTPMTRVTVSSDLQGAALALTTPSTLPSPPSPLPSPHSTLLSPHSTLPSPHSTLLSPHSTLPSPFIACIMGTGSIAALYEPATRTLHPMPALGYILGDEGSGAWLGRHVLGDYLKRQMPATARVAFEDDFGPISAESAIAHVYQQPMPNRYLATFAAFVGRHLDLRYSQELAYRGVEAFFQRNILPIADTEAGAGIYDVRLVGSVAHHLRPIIEQVAEYHDYCVTRILKDPIEGLV